ncbi:hypothetical protein BKK56_03655 [Rodentibacter genomosp. 2]|uniref:zonular occludens toxin domain-containing protein n=1 Tax=Rodentibacter genomosp. 2 TaxID=1908266 RepID=UPI0009865207|nr:hypothetical protein BKK56_03655 [Rodentibacter genomosp. 2]
MAISAYVGIPGSGKSYEVMLSVIVEHYKKGRRIVTNIEGVDVPRLIDFCLEDKKVKREALGELIKVSDEQCQQDDFFPYKGSTDTICKAGDLICLDEIWRIFPTEKIKENHRSFIAEHRHFTNEVTGLCCDLVVINQSVSAIPRFIKERIETTFLMSRLVALGMGKRYRVNVYTGAKTTKSNFVAQYQNKFNPKIFELYKSFDGVNGKQTTIDDRQNFLKSGSFKLMITAIVVLFSCSYYLIQDYFPSSNQVEEQEISQFDKSESKQIQSKTAQALYEEMENQTGQNQQPVFLSQMWRITGEIARGGEHFVVLMNNQGHLRLEPKHHFEGEGRALSGVINGERVTYYSGVKNEKVLF